jgi:hypothetical protein
MPPAHSAARVPSLRPPACGWGARRGGARQELRRAAILPGRRRAAGTLVARLRRAITSGRPKSAGSGCHNALLAPMEPPRPVARRPLSVAATERSRYIAGTIRTRLAYSGAARRLRRESARRAPIGERRHRAPAQRTAAEPRSLKPNVAISGRSPKSATRRGV